MRLGPDAVEGPEPRDTEPSPPPELAFKVRPAAKGLVGDEQDGHRLCSGGFSLPPICLSSLVLFPDRGFVLTFKTADDPSLSLIKYGGVSL